MSRHSPVAIMVMSDVFALFFWTQKRLPVIRWCLFCLIPLRQRQRLTTPAPRTLLPASSLYDPGWIDGDMVTVRVMSERSWSQLLATLVGKHGLLVFHGHSKIHVLRSSPFCSDGGFSPHHHHRKPFANPSNQFNTVPGHAWRDVERLSRTLIPALTRNHRLDSWRQPPDKGSEKRLLFG
jgi:hypothetical protein